MVAIRRRAAQPGDDAGAVGVGPVLAELALRLDPFDRQLDADDGAQLPFDEVVRRIVDRPGWWSRGCGHTSRFVPIGEVGDDLTNELSVVMDTNRRVDMYHLGGTYTSATVPLSTGPALRRLCAVSGDPSPPNLYATGVSGGGSLTWVAVILSDRTLREQLDAGRIVIDPFDESLIQPSSIDVRISNLFRVFRNHTRGVIDVKLDMVDLTELIEIPGGSEEPFMLHPGEFVLGSTLERIGVPDDLVGRVEGKSSLGRLGLLIHSTAGFIDAGFDGHITLELANVASLPITLYPGMKIGQVSFMQMTTTADNPYGKGASGSKYQGQRGPTPSRYFENFQR